MIERFTDGADGRRRVIENLLTQAIVSGNQELASWLADHCKLRELKPGETLIQQDGHDSDIFFILAGNFSVIVYSREIAERGSGTHVGEMAMIDTAAKRSATVIAKELSVVAQVTEGAFSEIANKFPSAWRNIAVVLGHRLRERSKFVRPPNEKPMIFVGSSSENVALADQVKDLLLNPSVDVKTWKDGVFGLSKSALDSLIQIARAYDFAVLIFDENDLVETRGKSYFAPRDNVIFELGLFMGSIGAERSYILRPNSVDLKIPSDLLGITCLPWDPKDLHASLSGLCAQITQQIKKLGPK